ncbi:hypothetical protein CROQUDRAFT_100877 [Cronartium quercuum f. sp. fusiforme G11]|uniref:Uncharacterized protein n=1 Tax=Cronartium quercuum f. sp. fusiforme G11 TaxID=708437 RepID=A0A9P6T5U0_9BASI|nr:hypothetical protein CROQUDRAFT_100877 [Cronartium quercuum f. sp. fusiforme G11]
MPKLTSSNSDTDSVDRIQEEITVNMIETNFNLQQDIAQLQSEANIPQIGNNNNMSKHTTHEHHAQ